MSKYVHDSAAAKSISAYVVMKGARLVAKVTAHYGNSRVLVNVWQEPAAYLRSAIAAKGLGPNATPPTDREAYDAFQFQHGSASGYGYDKFTAALAYLYIDGHRMADHSESWGKPKPPRGRRTYPTDFKAPKGWQLANFVRADRSQDGSEGYASIFRKDGLKYLEARGYTVIQVL